MADDELEAMQAIYCKPGELYISHGEDGSKQVKFRLRSTSEDDAPVNSVEAEVHLFLSVNYPHKAPDISVHSSCLSRKNITDLKAILCETAAGNLKQPMLMELITAASEELCRMAEDRTDIVQDCKENNSSTSTMVSPKQSDRSGDRLALLHWDHMRAKAQYVKVITKWIVELQLQGRLVFCRRFIFMLLQGPSWAIKEYLVRQKTHNVDVDSRGQPCKERMLSVVCDIPLSHCLHRFEDFEVLELSSVEDLRQFLEQCSVKDLLQDHIKTLKHFPGR